MGVSYTETLEFAHKTGIPESLILCLVSMPESLCRHNTQKIAVEENG
ncbi:MAG: hypothetical protein AABZ47_09870 [Planctomycetota bacterium]